MMYFFQLCNNSNLTICQSDIKNEVTKIFYRGGTSDYEHKEEGVFIGA